MRGWIDRLRIKGFVGPRYRGAGGKLRFVLESVVSRTDLVFVATPDTVGGAAPRSVTDLVMRRVPTVGDLDPFRRGIDDAYYEGHAKSFEAPFGWGEEAFIGTVGGAVASFAWAQFGTPTGYPTYYGRLLEGDARILRVGVAPAFRQRGINTAMLRWLVATLFHDGYNRIFIECYENNIPSVRSFQGVGFSLIGRLSVIEIPPLRGFVRWEDVRLPPDADPAPR